MWSACTTGFSAVNAGATDGTPLLVVFHRSTSARISARSDVSSVISWSTCLNSNPISCFQRARGLCALELRVQPRGQRVVLPAQLRSRASQPLDTRLRALQRPLEDDAVGAREHALHVEDDNQTVVHLCDAAQKFRTESAE